MLALAFVLPAACAWKFIPGLTKESYILVCPKNKIPTSISLIAPSGFGLIKPANV